MINQAEFNEKYKYIQYKPRLFVLVNVGDNFSCAHADSTQTALYSLFLHQWLFAQFFCFGIIVFLQQKQKLDNREATKTIQERRLYSDK